MHGKLTRSAYLSAVLQNSDRHLSNNWDPNISTTPHNSKVTGHEFEPNSSTSCKLNLDPMSSSEARPLGCNEL